MKNTLLTPKQQEILIALYQFRFLTSTHIQHLLHNKNKTPTNRLLTKLTTQGYIHRIYSKQREVINIDAMYYLATPSMKQLEKILNLPKAKLRYIYKEPTHTLWFQKNCLLTADLYFEFLKIAEESRGSLEFCTGTHQREIANLPDPHPTAFITLKSPTKKTKHHYLETLNLSMPRFALRNMVRKYCRFYADGYWQQETTETFPSILLICPTTQIITFYQRYIPTLLKEQDIPLRIFLGLESDIRARGLQNDTWQRAD